MFVLLAVACATQEKYERRLNDWVGRSEEELISSLGVPTSTHNLNSGGKLILYRNRGTAVIGGGSIGPAEIDNKGMTWCETTFKLGPDAKVLSASFKGNACRSK